VLDTGADLLVGLVVRFLPGWQVFALASTTGHDQPRAGIAAIGDRECPADRGHGAGFLPRLAVVAVPGQRSADGDDEPGVGIDDDLVVGGVPVVLRLLGDGVVAGGYQGCRPR
jgi:hypothetical protein